MKNKILILSAIALAIIFSLIIYYKNNDCYIFKVEIRLDDTLAKKIDSIIASEIKDNLSQVEELKEIVIFSRANICSVYCKIYPFVFNKALIANRLEKKINETMLNIDKNASVTFDDNFCVKYQTFLVISSDRVDYKILKKYHDEILDKLLGLRISSKVLTIGEQQRTAYINFKNSDLAKYDINLEDIENIIQKNNILQDSTIKTNSSNSYNIKTNGSINSIEDVKNIALFYKNKKFSIKFKDAFKIEESTKEPLEVLAFLDNQKAIVLAISKKKFYPDFLFNLKLKKFVNDLKKNFPCYINLNLFNVHPLLRIEMYFNNRTSIYNTKNEYEKIYSKLKEDSIKNILFLIGTDSPRISNEDEFFETQKNKLIIFTNKFHSRNVKDILNSKGINYLKKNDEKVVFEDYDLDKLYRKIEEYKEEYPQAIIPYTNKTAQINYEIDNFSLNDFLVDKSEIINSIKSAYDGYNAGYYYDNSVKIPIVLQNQDNLERLYYYSKYYKTLIYLGTTSKSTLKNDFSTIVRRNEKYRAKIIIK